MIFGIKEKEPYNVLLAIAANIPVLLMTAFVLQAHICADIHSNECVLISLIMPQLHI